MFLLLVVSCSYLCLVTRLIRYHDAIKDNNIDVLVTHGPCKGKVDDGHGCATTLQVPHMLSHFIYMRRSVVYEYCSRLALHQPDRVAATAPPGRQWACPLCPRGGSRR
jgi:hypothetical protein